MFMKRNAVVDDGEMYEWHLEAQSGVSLMQLIVEIHAQKMSTNSFPRHSALETVYQYMTWYSHIGRPTALRIIANGLLRRHAIYVLCDFLSNIQVHYL